MKKRILVTGGAGFLGSHLCERLLNNGNEVICVDNFYTGRRSNIAHLLSSPYFEVLRHDICFPLYVETDEIYNLACPASPIHYQFDPVQTTKTSVHGAINMLGLLKGEDITVYGDGSQTMSFCYVDDLIDGLINLMNSADDFTGTVNLGNPAEFTILELAEKVIKLTKSMSKIVFKPLPSDDPTQRQPDITLAAEKLKWKPSIPLEDGLKTTIEYFRNII